MIMSSKEFTALCLLPVLTFLSYSALELFLPVRVDEPVEIHVEEGMVFSDVVRRLGEKGLLRDGNAVLLLGRITGIDREIKSGFYEFRGSISPYGVVDRLLEGRTVEFDVTIPEGYNIWQIARLLDDRGVVTEESFLTLATDRAFLAGLGIDAPSVEGYIFPDTYRLPKGMDARDLLRRMVSEMRRRFSPEMKQRAAELGLTEREVLTLASIIEKEAVLDEERPLISAVFHNRLRMGMPLQADPTSIYGVKSPSEGITVADLRRRTPYNTYLISGLPPGPIASPGMKSILAALYPADVDYLYFVSSNNGRHHFSSTEAEHRRAVRTYRRSRR